MSDTQDDVVDPMDEIRALAENDEGGVDEIHVIDEAFHDTAKPLLVIVHPGDAVEDGDAPRDIYEDSRQFQQAMADGIRKRLKTHDVVIIHRVSSLYALIDGGHAEWMYSDVFDEAVEMASNLYGDGLDEAAAWIEEHLEASKRPLVYMTGAFSEPEYGCLAAVGKALAAAGAIIEVDPYSPSEPGSIADQWKPGAPAISPTI